MTFYECSHEGCSTPAIIRCSTCGEDFCLQHAYEAAKDGTRHSGPALEIDHSTHPDNQPTVYALVCDGPGPHDPEDGILGTTTIYGHLGHRCQSDACQIPAELTA